jgi:hypothetical protein
MDFLIGFYVHSEFNFSWTGSFVTDPPPPISRCLLVVSFRCMWCYVVSARWLVPHCHILLAVLPKLFLLIYKYFMRWTDWRLSGFCLCPQRGFTFRPAGSFMSAWQWTFSCKKWSTLLRQLSGCCRLNEECDPWWYSVNPVFIITIIVSHIAWYLISWFCIWMLIWPLSHLLVMVLLFLQCNFVRVGLSH